jgi:hypothetical protein
MSERWSGPPELGLREKNDWSGGEAQSTAEGVKDYDF